VSGSGPRTRVRRLWLLHLSPDPVHASPLREPLPDTIMPQMQQEYLPATHKLVKALTMDLPWKCFQALGSQDVLGLERCRLE
jgi:hypothetical protein